MTELDTRTGRDTRLLALVIVIAVAVLFALARFRFPVRDTPPAPQSPLERLAATGTYDDLAAAVRSALQAATPALVIVELERIPPDKAAADAAMPSPAPSPVATPEVKRRQIAVRLRTDAAVAYVPSGFRVVATDAADGWSSRTDDVARELAVLTPRQADGGVPAVRTVSDFGGFAYVAIVEAAPGGPTARPVFVGRVDPQTDERWPGAVLVGGSPIEIPDGALVFLLDGRFAGIAITTIRGARAIAPPSLITAVIDTSPGAGR
jgi:hypothetical protein